MISLPEPHHTKLGIGRSHSPHGHTRLNLRCSPKPETKDVQMLYTPAQYPSLTGHRRIPKRPSARRHACCLVLRCTFLDDWNLLLQPAR
jgi:hypothetical protein